MIEAEEGMSIPADAPDESEPYDEEDDLGAPDDDDESEDD